MADVSRSREFCCMVMRTDTQQYLTGVVGDAAFWGPRAMTATAMRFTENGAYAFVEEVGRDAPVTLAVVYRGALAP